MKTVRDHLAVTPVAAHSEAVTPKTAQTEAMAAVEPARSPSQAAPDSGQNPAPGHELVTAKRQRETTKANDRAATPRPDSAPPGEPSADRQLEATSQAQAAASPGQPATKTGSEPASGEPVKNTERQPNPAETRPDSPPRVSGSNPPVPLPPVGPAAEATATAVPRAEPRSDIARPASEAKPEPAKQSGTMDRPPANQIAQAEKANPEPQPASKEPIPAIVPTAQESRLVQNATTSNPPKGPNSAPSASLAGTVIGVMDAATLVVGEELVRLQGVAPGPADLLGAFGRVPPGGVCAVGK
jgi:hypothetical protein